LNIYRIRQYLLVSMPSAVPIPRTRIQSIRGTYPGPTGPVCLLSPRAKIAKKMTAVAKSYLK
jgi:hypothetical protein